MPGVFARFGFARFDALPIVAHLKHDRTLAHMGSQGNGVGVGMFDDVRASLLQQAQQLQAVLITGQKRMRHGLCLPVKGHPLRPEHRCQPVSQHGQQQRHRVLALVTIGKLVAGEHIQHAAQIQQGVVDQFGQFNRFGCCHGTRLQQRTGRHQLRPQPIVHVADQSLTFLGQQNLFPLGLDFRMDRGQLDFLSSQFLLEADGGLFLVAQVAHQTLDHQHADRHGQQRGHPNRHRQSRIGQQALHPSDVHGIGSNAKKRGDGKGIVRQIMRAGRRVPQQVKAGDQGQRHHHKTQAQQPQLPIRRGQYGQSGVGQQHGGQQAPLPEAVPVVHQTQQHINARESRHGTRDHEAGYPSSLAQGPQPVQDNQIVQTPAQAGH